MIPFMNPVRGVLLAGFAAALAAGFLLVPAGTTLPVHWNAAGVADSFLPREAALLMPAAVLALVWGIFAGVARFAKPDDVEAGRYVTGVSLTALTALFLAIEVILVLIGVGMDVNVVQVLALGFGLLMLVLGNAMPKSRPNSFAGIRMPSTLRDSANWQATHRLGGRLAILGGLVLLLAALLVPKQDLIWWLVGCVLLPMLTAAAYSLVLERRARRGLGS